MIIKTNFNAINDLVNTVYEETLDMAIYLK